MSVHGQYNSFIMLTQKLYRNGNSVVITIPKEILKDLGLKDGSDIMIEKKDDGIFIKGKSDPKLKLTPEFKNWLDDISSRYQDTIKELAKR